MAVKILEVPLVGDVNEDEARIALAAELYREGKMTLKQAADTDTAQLTLWDFLYELGTLTPSNHREHIITNCDIKHAFMI